MGKYYKIYKESGRCIDCGKPLDREGVRCISCNNKSNIARNNLRKWYLENKICPRCRKETLFGSETVCLNCSVKSMEYTENWNKNHKERCLETARRTGKARYKLRVDTGICYRCGKRKADYGFKSCGICREKMSEIKKRKANNKPTKPSTECKFCNKPVFKDYKVCEYHYNELLEKSKKTKKGKVVLNG